MEGEISLESMLHEIRNMRKDIKTEVSALKSTIDSKFDYLVNNAKEVTAKLEVHASKVKNIEKELIRKNLVIYGLEEEREEKFGDLKSKIMCLLNTKMELNIKMDDIDDFYRLGRSGAVKRPIVLKMTTSWRKMEVLKNTAKLRGSKVYIDTDLTMEEQDQRKENIELMKVFRRKGDFAVVRGSTLFVNGSIYKGTHTWKTVDTNDDQRNGEETRNQNLIREEERNIISGSEVTQRTRMQTLMSQPQSVHQDASTETQKKRQISPYSTRVFTSGNSLKKKKVTTHSNQQKCGSLQQTSLESFLDTSQKKDAGSLEDEGKEETHQYQG